MNLAKSMNGDKKKNIVIVGAGFGGLKTALKLSKKLFARGGFTLGEKKQKDYQIILIDKNSYHTYTPSLYEVATAYRGAKLNKNSEERNFAESLAGSSCFLIRDILKNTNITFIQGEVVNVNLDTKNIITKSQDAIPYEYLILAPGSEVAYYKVEGAEVCCNSLKTLLDALRLRVQIENFFNKAVEEKKELTFITIGAGFSGFEVVAEAIKYVKNLCCAKNLDKSRVHIKLVDAGNKILPSVSEKMRHKAEKRLKKLGVEVMTSANIIKIEPHALYLESGEKINADLILWGGGVKGSDWLKKINGLEFDKSGRVLVDEYLKAKDDVFVIGDSAYFKDAKRDIVVPATAWVAEQEAGVTALNIYNLINGKTLMKYVPKFVGFVSAAGGKYAIAYIYGVTFSGFKAWLLKRFIDLKYILSIYPFWKGFGIWLRELDLWSRND